MAHWSDEVCEECGAEGGSHTPRHWREIGAAIAAQDCPPAPPLPAGTDYGEPPF